MALDAMKLWLDDTRPAPPGWTWCRTFKEAKALMNSRQVTEMSLDHDLGGKKNGYDFVMWMAQNKVWPKERPTVHSANPYGAMRMRGALLKYGPW